LEGLIANKEIIIGDKFQKIRLKDREIIQNIGKINNKVEVKCISTCQIEMFINTIIRCRLTNSEFKTSNRE
jgi:S-adenosylhomocysteine hydrolase